MKKQYCSNDFESHESVMLDCKVIIFSYALGPTSNGAGGT